MLVGCILKVCRKMWRKLKIEDSWFEEVAVVGWSWDRSKVLGWSFRNSADDGVL
jgi:hypothetical protein